MKQALWCTGLALAAAAADSDVGLKTITANALKGHVYFLASDEMGGRDSLSPQGRIAAQYIAGFFHRADLKPVGDQGTYFQNFPMVEATLDKSRTHLRATIGVVDRDYAEGPDYTLPRGRAEWTCV